MNYVGLRECMSLTRASFLNMQADQSSSCLIRTSFPKLLFRTTKRRQMQSMTDESNKAIAIDMFSHDWLKKSRAKLSTNERQSPNQSCFERVIFRVL